MEVLALGSQLTAASAHAAYMRSCVAHVLLGTGAFVGLDGKPVAVPEDLPNANMRLFGGAQYHRAMAEFRSAVGVLTCPDISREEIVNACGGCPTARLHGCI